MTDRTLGLVIVAAGESRRMGGLSKVWAPLAGRPLLWHSVARLGPEAFSTVVVVRSDDVQRARAELDHFLPPVVVVPGGSERYESVQRGLDALPPVDLIAVHDAARPLASSRLVAEARMVLRGADGAVPLEPIPDTVKRVGSENRVLATVDRTGLRRAQTPQIFRADILRQSYSRLRVGDAVTDDSAVVESGGYEVRGFDGPPWNFKVTTPYDLTLVRALVDLGIEW